MPVDPYAICPCGSGKKLKFCCSDLVGEIEKIHRMIEGEQPRAALRHVEQTLATHPGRASLLDLKATLELSLGEIDAARETVEKFVATNADSPTAHACQALLLAETGEVRPAIDSLQRALALVEREMPMRVYEALGSVGGAALEAGHILAAQAHLWLHAALAPKEDTRAREVLAALNHYSGLPLLFRDQLRFRPWPQDAPWKEEAEKASRLADHGKWQQAVAAIDRLGAKYGADPTLVFNRALLGGWLADDRALVAGLHAFAQLEVPLDDAVEAEAIAQLLDQDLKEQRIDTTIQAFAINDLDTLTSRLLSDKRIQPFEMNPEMFAEREQPRPRNTYRVARSGRCRKRASRPHARRRTPDRRRHRSLRPANRSARAARIDDRPGSSLRSDPCFAERDRRRRAGRHRRRTGDRLGFADRSGAQLALASTARYAARSPPATYR